MQFKLQMKTKCSVGKTEIMKRIIGKKQEQPDTRRQQGPGTQKQSAFVLFDNFLFLTDYWLIFIRNGHAVTVCFQIVTSSCDGWWERFVPFFFSFLFFFLFVSVFPVQKVSKLNNWIRIIIYLLYSKQQAISWGSKSNKNDCPEKFWRKRAKSTKASLKTVHSWNEQREHRKWKHVNNGVQYIFCALIYFSFNTCRHGYHTDNLKHIFHTSHTPWTLNTYPHTHTHTPILERRGKTFSEFPIQQQQCNDNNIICTENDERNAFVDMDCDGGAFLSIFMHEIK